MGRPVGRPSLTAPFRDVIVAALQADPAVRSLDLLERAKRAGYAGKGSAFYELVVTVREESGIARPSREERKQLRSAEREARRVEQERLREERVTRRAGEAVEEVERRAHRARERDERRQLQAANRAVPFEGLVLELLTTNPAMQSVEIVKHATAAGYRGRNTALYNLVSRVRREHGMLSAKDQWRKAKREGLEGRRARRAEQRAERDRRPQHEREADMADPSRLRAHARLWFEDRKTTHRNWISEVCIWRKHLAPTFGDLQPSELDVTKIRAFVEAKRATGMSSTTVGRCIAVLSSLFTSLIESGTVGVNPVKMVPRKVRYLYRNARAPEDTPFIEKPADITRLAAELPDPLKTMYLLGAMSALRTGEIVALEWSDLRNDLRFAHVRRSYRPRVVSTPKNGRPRVVPLSPACSQLLRAWRDRTGSTGLVFPPIAGARSSAFIDIYKLYKNARWYEVLKRLGLPRMRFYEGTRHSAASAWVMGGLKLEKVSKILGHSDFRVTQRYAHLSPENMTVPDVVAFDGPAANDQGRFPTGDA